MSRTFNLGDVLSVTTGYLVSPRGVDALYDVVNFMTGDNLFTHQLPRGMDEAKPHILAQHPDLASAAVPEGGWPDEASLWAWVAEQVDKFGSTRDLTPMPAEDHRFIDPLTELHMMAPGKPVIAIEIDGDTP